MSLKTRLYQLQLQLRHRLAERTCPSGSSSTGKALDGTPNRVLFVLAGLIGDSVMCLPAISEARRLWPASHITVLGKSHNLSLIKGCAFFDEFRVCDVDPFSLRGRKHIRDLQQWLDAGGFDVAIILLGDQYAHLLARAGIPVRVGVKGASLQNCLTHVYDIGSPRTWGSRERLNSLRVLGCDVQDVPPRLSVASSASDTLSIKLADMAVELNEKLVVLHPFGSTRAQWWPCGMLTPLSQHLTSVGLTPVLTGGPDVMHADMGIVPEQTVDTRGKLTLDELVALIGRSSAVITTDSGPFHVAGALEKPTIGLFRAIRPEHADAYSSAVVIFGEDDQCQRQCSWDLCRTSPCVQMAAIQPRKVVEAVRHTLG
jgi:ADP-heptose:LPS heptosyltransferase